ncbi:DnaJ family domain-containing protein [Shimia sagamensis]|uniref:DnaJ homologue subfamily C member 28 conserved domain-containing protein n=1 Tax=Shimia sagamensis TaxID=1566352 RepID=A0ABY1PGC4_9RHOB|nr:DnaJ family domain-containing protein [Shimia sagamensis]SMP33678.1 protein of unknown function [Shimia sagamensis]
MDHPLSYPINQKICWAEAGGEFDNLEGAGKPLRTDAALGNVLLNRLVDVAGGEPKIVPLSREPGKLRGNLREVEGQCQRQDIFWDMPMSEAKIDLARKVHG